jgi:hypothetical protein
MGTYAILNNSNNEVLDIIEMNILSDIPVAYMEASYIRVGEPTLNPIPTIGQIWNGETFE